jgi:hypothetical protein
VIQVQLGAARSKITPKYFWRFKRDTANVEPVTRESQGQFRRFDDPVPAYIFVNHRAKEKELDYRGVEDEIPVEFSIDLAECIRLGELYDTTDPGITDFRFYLPQAADVFQWDSSLYEINDITTPQDGFYEPVQRVIKWQGTATLLKEDSANVSGGIRPITTDILGKRNWH